MTTVQSVITILIIMLGTMLTRFISFLIFKDNKPPPPYIKYLGTVLPYAVIGLLVIYSLKDAFGGVFYGIPEIIAIFFIVILHKWKKNTLLSIGAGTFFYMFLVQNLF